MKRTKPPKEDPTLISFRERQVRELADLDEEENRRIKQALVPRNRAFRRSSGGQAGSSSGRSSVRSNSGSTGRVASTRAQSFNP